MGNTALQPEIEAKFLGVDFAQLRLILAELGAECVQPMRLMKRVIIEPEEVTQSGRDAFIRIRDEGDRVTLTYKEFQSASLSGAGEHQVVVSSFDDTVAIFAAAGLDYRSYQESRRETWRLGDVEVVLDEWPWIDSYCEIEGPTESAVRQVAGTLGLDFSQAVFGSVDVIYQRTYPAMTHRGVIDEKEVRFNLPLPTSFGKKGILNT